MSSTLIKIYILIALECRLSLEDASTLFNIDIDTLRQEFAKAPLGLTSKEALEYLYYETSTYEKDNQKGKFKAKLFLRRLQKILHIENKDEKRAKLKAFVDELSGPSITFALNKNNYYSKEEQEMILKYHLKYAVPERDLLQSFNIHNETLKNWENNLPEGEQKTRLGILRRYLSIKKSRPKKGD